MSKELKEWIKIAYSKGKTKEEIISLLMASKWPEDTIKACMDQLDIENEAIPKPGEIVIDKKIKIPNLFNKKKIPETANVYKCPNCGVEMINEVAKDWLENEAQKIKGLLIK